MDGEQKRKGNAFGPPKPILHSVHRNQYRIRSKNQKLSSSSPIIFLSVSLSHRFSCSWWRKRGQTIRCLRRASTNTQTQKPAVISVCIRLMLGGGDWKPSLFKWEIQHLLKSMGFDAGSRLGGGDWKPSLFKWEIQHLLKSMGFDAGSGLGGVDEHLPPGWALINPAESHQRCWAEIHDPPGMPIFYGWRHGVGRKCHSATLERPEHFLATTRTLQCFTSKLGHRGRATTSAANHKDVRGKSQRDRHPRCHASACLSDGLDELIRKTGFWTRSNFEVLHYPSKTFSFIILDPSGRSNLGPLDLEKKSTSRRFFQIRPRTTHGLLLRVYASQWHWACTAFEHVETKTEEMVFFAKKLTFFHRWRS